jgi:hypothetical protein
VRWLLFLWWDLHPSLNIRLLRRCNPAWPREFTKAYLTNVTGQMSPLERAYVHSRMGAEL